MNLAQALLLTLLSPIIRASLILPQDARLDASLLYHEADILQRDEAVPHRQLYPQQPFLKSQQLLNANISHGSTDPTRPISLPLVWTGWEYYTTIALGTPPQPFNAILNIAETRVMALSANCTSSTCESGDLWTYNSTASTTSYNTFMPNVESSMSIVNVIGRTTYDTLHLLGLSVPRQPFSEIIEVVPKGFFLPWSGLTTGLMGLAPPWGPLRTTLLGTLNWAYGIGKFAIKTPLPYFFNGTIDSSGDLTLNGTNTKYHDPAQLRRLRSKFAAEPWLQGKWTVAATGASIVSNGKANGTNGTVLVSREFSDTTGVFDLGSFIGLPSAFFNEVIAAIGARSVMEGILFGVRCDTVDTLPNVVLQLDGQDFPLTGRQYTSKTVDFSGESFCLVAFVNTTRMYLEPEGVVIIGSWFLSAWYAVFEFGQRNNGVALAPIKG